MLNFGISERRHSKKGSADDLMPSTGGSLRECTTIYEHARRWKMRTRITLACTECKQRNYNTTKDKKAHPDRMETKKYCRFCKKHTTHKETK